MYKTRMKKIWGDVRSRLLRTALVSIAIFVGVMGTIAMFSLSDIIVSQLREDIQEDDLSMLDVFTTLQPGNELDDAAYLAQLEEDVPGLTEVFGAVQGFIQFKTDPESEDFENGGVTGYTIPLEDGLPIEPMRLTDGNYPQAGANEVVIEQRMADEYDLAVGDTLYFRILSPSRDGNGDVGTTEGWTISGIVFHPYIGATQGSSAAAPDATIYATLEDSSYISGITGLTLFRARFTDFATADEYTETFNNIIASDTPYIPVFTATQDPATNQLIVQAQTLGNTMGFLALVSLIVSGFLVINVISSIIVEQKKQIGVLKSLGANTGDNFFMYSGIALAYGLIGVIPGVLVGIPLGNFAAQAIAPQVNTVLDGFQTSPPSIILGIAVGLLVPVLASILPVFGGTRVKILDAMTDLGIDVNYGSGPIAKLIGALPIPITIRQGLSNISLKKWRLFFTVFTLAVAVGTFIGIFAVFSSLTSGIDLFLDSFNVEVGTFPNETRDPDELRAILQEFSDNYEGADFVSIEPGANTQVEFEGYEPPVGTGGPPGIFAYAYDVNSPNPAFNFEVDEGEALNDTNGADGIILSSLLADNMGKSVGDEVILKVPGNSVELTVVGISDFPIEQVWMDWRTLSIITGFTTGAPRPNEYNTTVAVADYDGSLADGQITVIGFDEQVANFLSFSDGEFVTIGEPGVIISESAAENGDLSVGDEVTLTAQNGDMQAFPVVGIFSLPPMIQDPEMPTDVMGMYYRDLATFEGLSMDGKPIPQGFFIVTDLEDPTVDELDAVVDDLNEALLSEGISAINFNFVELTEQISEAFFIIQAILQAVSLLIALVGALGLLTTLSMSVFERQKEIGVMRSIGAGSSTIALQFLTEGLVVGIIAWLVGLPLSYLIEVGLLEATGFADTFPAVFPVNGAIVGLIGMLVITTIASLWPSLSAANRTVSDILRYQ